MKKENGNAPGVIKTNLKNTTMAKKITFMEWLAIYYFMEPIHDLLMSAYRLYDAYDSSRCWEYLDYTEKVFASDFEIKKHHLN